MTRRNRTADNLAHRLDRAAEILPIIRQHLNEQRALVGALPSRGEGGRQGGTHSDPTGRTLEALSAFDHKWRIIEDALASINVGVNMLERECDGALRMRAIPAERGEPIEIPRCSAKSRDGAIEWSDPTCTNVPTRGPLCDRCSKREYRWRQAHGLPSRVDGVFSEPAA